jgi:GNAT superfamily N-acetyltransferase
VRCGESQVQREYSIRPVDPHDGERLQEIAIAAKSYWGYDLERVMQWAATGDYSPQGLREKDVYVAETQGSQVIGWASLILRDDACSLDDLWVEPEWIGQRVGSLLFRHMVERAKQRGATRMEWEAEPNALGFYGKMGGRYLRDSELSTWGRVIPVMGIDLT